MELVLRENPFYVESGGQVSDVGGVAGPGWSLSVDAVRKDPKGTVVGGTFGETFEPDSVRRGGGRAPAARHRAEPQRHAPGALRAAQAPRHRTCGSRDRWWSPTGCASTSRITARSTPTPCTRSSSEVNELVLANEPVVTREMAYPDALALGAMAFFSEKYGDRVRVVQMGPSIELCGGTHVRTTGQIGTLPRSRARAAWRRACAGSRRVTGTGALRAVRELEQRLAQVAEALKAQPEHLVRRVEQLLEERQRLEARLAEALRSGGGGAIAGEHGGGERRAGDDRRDRHATTAPRWGRWPTGSARASATRCWCSSAARAGAPFT